MKLYKATVSFAGKVCMAVNEERRLADKDAAGLLKCGYIKPVDNTAEQQAENEADSNTAETNAEETAAETADSASETEETVPENSESVNETAEQPKSKKK